AAARPVRRQNGLPESWQLERDRAVGIERKRCAVEDQFVLAANLIDIDQRQTGLRDALPADIEPSLGLVAPVWRAIRHHQELGAGLTQTFDDILVVAPFGP